MKQMLTLVIFLSLFSSCIKDKRTELLIKNNSGFTIDTLRITYGTEKISKSYFRKSINSGDTISTVFDMNFKGIDGGYLLEIYQNKKKTGKYFGYYSNATFKNYIYNLRIEKDTLLIEKSIEK
ncbi:hypothetical protein [uncultured Winogradskyella sp.]|uniref:hypothetical protein n=1 Tax=uncultured Winogradskyella sp. TaxID=395353 RepID=UPI00262CF50C|nr:hypothetical protein [uncultured Winogradskyella sp.]